MGRSVPAYSKENHSTTASPSHTHTLSLSLSCGSNLLKIGNKHPVLVAYVECLSRAFVSMISSCLATGLHCSQRGLLQEGAVIH